MYYLKKTIYNSPEFNDGTIVYRSEHFNGNPLDSGCVHAKWNNCWTDSPVYMTQWDTFSEAEERAIPLGCTVCENTNTETEE